MPIGDSRDTAVSGDLLRLLAEIARAGCFYEALSPEPMQARQLCDLEARGCIRYCPYPEEFWIVLPAGEELLLGSQAPRRSRAGTG